MNGESRSTALDDLGLVVNKILGVCTPDVHVIAYSTSDPTIRGDAAVIVANDAEGEGEWATGTAGRFVVPDGLPVGSLDPDHALLIRLRDDSDGYRNAVYLKGIPRAAWDESNRYITAPLTGFGTAMTALLDELKLRCSMVNKLRGSNPPVALVSDIHTAVDQRIIRRAGGRSSYFSPVGRRLAR